MRDVVLALGQTSEMILILTTISHISYTDSSRHCSSGPTVYIFWVQSNHGTSQFEAKNAGSWQLFVVPIDRSCNGLSYYRNEANKLKYESVSPSTVQVQSYYLRVEKAGTVVWQLWIHLQFHVSYVIANGTTAASEHWRAKKKTWLLL